MCRRSSLALLFITILVMCAESYAKDNLMSNGDTIYYLSGDAIRMITLPDNKNATVVFKVPKETASEKLLHQKLSLTFQQGLLSN
jgi:hypothetical protein